MKRWLATSRRWCGFNAASALVLLYVCSCSFIGVRGPPATADAGSIRCTNDYGLVAVDAIGVGVASYFGAELIYDGATVRTDTNGGGAQGIVYAASVPFLLSDAVYIASAIYGAYNVHECRNAKRSARTAMDTVLRMRADESRELREQQHQIEQLERARLHAQERAARLTKTAAEAARTGDCTTVTQLDPQIRATDPEFYDIVFVHDAAIARCLAQNASQATP